MPELVADTAADASRIRISVQPISEHVSQLGAEVLRAAWNPPCLRYTPEMIQFQAQFPAAVPTFTVVAANEKPIAFVAAMGRDSTIGPIHLSSFYSSVPGYPGSVAISLVRRELAEMKRIGIPALVFAAAASTGDAMVRASEIFGRPQIRLKDCRIHMALRRPMPPGFQVGDIDPNDWAAQADKFGQRDPSILSLAFSPETMCHMARDPLGRRFLAATNEGQVAGLAIVTCTETLQRDGTVQAVTNLSYVRLGHQRAEGLSALIAAADAPVVTLPNVTGIPPEILKSAQVRATPACFTAYLAAGPPGIEATDIEIV